MQSGQESLAHRLIQPYLRSNTLCKLLIVGGCRSVMYVFLFVAIGFIFMDASYLMFDDMRTQLRAKWVCRLGIVYVCRRFGGYTITVVFLRSSILNRTQMIEDSRRSLNL